jgi:dynein heavy chain
VYLQVLVGNYEEAVKMMGDMAFLQSLMNFPKEAINDETVELLQPYFAAPDLNYEAAKKASGNVAGLCNWAEAMCQFHVTAKVVEPKIVKLRESEDELRVATKERQVAEDELATVQARLDEMQRKFDGAMANKKALEDDAADTQRKMTNAAALIAALGGEESRWITQRTSLEASVAALVGDCALASSFLSYMGPFNRAFRERLLSDLREDCARLGIPTTAALQVTTFLAEETEVGQWAVEGLPTDNLSIQNGILVSRAARCPLLVDPQGQGRAWLLRHAKDLRVSQLGDKHFRNHLEECLNCECVGF